MKKVILIAIVFLIITVVTFKYVYKDHRDIVSERVEFVVESEDLILEFDLNSELASQKYLNKTIEVIGIITGIEKDIVMLNNSIVCYGDNAVNNIPTLNSRVIVKGRFIGYDDLLEEIKMDQTSIVE